MINAPVEDHISGRRIYTEKRECDTEQHHKHISAFPVQAAPYKRKSIFPAGDQGRNKAE